MPKVRQKAKTSVEQHAKKAAKAQKMGGKGSEGGNGGEHTKRGKEAKKGKGETEGKELPPMVAAANQRQWDASLDWFVA
jgi:hypothetical protein